MTSLVPPGPPELQTNGLHHKKLNCQKIFLSTKTMFSLEILAEGPKYHVSPLCGPEMGSRCAPVRGKMWQSWFLPCYSLRSFSGCLPVPLYSPGKHFWLRDPASFRNPNPVTNTTILPCGFPRREFSPVPDKSQPAG